MIFVINAPEKKNPDVKILTGELFRGATREKKCEKEYSWGLTGISICGIFDKVGKNSASRELQQAADTHGQNKML